MKRLTITYDGSVVYDADVAAYKFEETAAGVLVEAKKSAPQAARRQPSNWAGILNGLAAASKQAQLEQEQPAEVESEVTPCP